LASTRRVALFSVFIEEAGLSDGTGVREMFSKKKRGFAGGFATTGAIVTMFGLPVQI
jgi:hypothetical protein